MLLPHVPPPITPNHQQPIRQIMQRRAQRVKNMSTKGATRLQVFSDARKSDPGKLLASCTCTPVKITLLVVTLKSHDKEGARSESNKQTEISAQRMHSFYTIHMGCGYLPGGCEQYSIVRGSHDPRCKWWSGIVKRGVQPTNVGLEKHLSFHCYRFCVHKYKQCSTSGTESCILI